MDKLKKKKTAGERGGHLVPFSASSGSMQLQKELKQKQTQEGKDAAGKDVGDNWSGRG